MPGSLKSGQRVRWLLGAAAGVLLSLSVAAPAFADTASLSVTTSSGQSDPAAGVPRVFTLSGNASVSEEVFVKYRATGGAACAPTAYSDSGTILDEHSANPSYYGTTVNGNFSIRNAFTWGSPGAVMFCIWLAKDDQTVTSPITQVITFRSPTGSISATLNPASPQVGQTTTVNVTGSSEAPASVFATVRSAGTPCGPTYDSDSGHGLINGTNVNGSFSTQASLSESTPGAYVICLWLAQSSSDTSPIAGPQPEPFTVLAPPAPCVVPHFPIGALLATVRQRLLAAGCSIGRVRYTHSRHFPRGWVLLETPSPGASLPHGTAVDVLVSTGPAHPKGRHKRKRHKKSHH
jgi:hypothetical protein